MKKNMWKRVAAISVSFGMLMTSMPAMAFDDVMIVEDDSYIAAEDETEAMIAPASDDIDEGYFDQSFISEDEAVEVEDDTTLNGIIDETEAELYAAADDAIPIDKAHFPDESFRAVLRDRYDPNYDEVLSANEIAGITQMNVGSSDITSLEGIEYFTNLTDLYCVFNQLTSLDVSKNTALEDLACEGNQLTSLDLSGNTALVELSCYSNQLTSLNVSKNMALAGLSCDFNQLTSLDLSGNTALTSLGCSYNQLTSLDLSGNTALVGLSCSYNQLTSLNVSKSTALVELSCDNNQLTSLDVSNNSALTDLDCYENKLTNLNVSNNLALEYLRCYDNQLTSLDISKNIALKSLNCSRNKLSSLSVGTNTDLAYLNCDENMLTYLDVTNNTVLEGLDCDKNQLTSLDVSKNVALEELNCVDNLLTRLNVEKNTTLWSLYCSGNRLTNLDVSNNTDLRRLSCKRNRLTNLDVRKNTSLKWLFCEDNQLTSLDISKNTELFILTCYSNHFTSLDIGSCSYLVDAYQQGECTTDGSTIAYNHVVYYGRNDDGSEDEDDLELSYDKDVTITINDHNPYNMFDETYSFENYGDLDSLGGHCFGMSITSAGFYNGLLDIRDIGGDENTSLYSYSLTATVKAPICRYQHIQGSYSRRATVAGGSKYLRDEFDIVSDWREVVNYVKSHQFDDTGLLQIGIRKENRGGNAIKFLRYEAVDGQDRIYVYDNNFPDRETYFYKDSSGRILQAPKQTYSGGIDCIALRDVRKYFNVVITDPFNLSRVIYMGKDDASVQGYDYTYMETDLPDVEYVMYEIPAGVESVTIIPKKDDATFTYKDKQYSFGKVTKETYGTLKLSSEGESGDGSEKSFEIRKKTTTKKPSIAKEKITISKKPTIKKPAAAKGKITVKWKHFKHTSKKTKKIWKKIKKVQIQCATDKAFKNIVKTATVKKSKTSAKVKGLKKKTTYYVRVRYYDGTGYSAWSKVKKVKTK